MPRLPVLVAALLSVAVSGCANRAVPDKFFTEYKHHYVLVHRDGHALQAVTPGDPGAPLAGNKELTHGDFQSYLDDMTRQIDVRARQMPAASAGDCAGEPLRILLFVHGGLNGYASDYLRMKKLFSGHRGFFDVPKPKNEDRPAEARSVHYPIFVNWNSSLMDSIADDVFFIRNGRRGDWWETIPLAPFVLLSRITQSVFGAPVSWGRSIDNYNDGVNELPPFEQWSDRISSLPLTPIRAITTPVVEAFGTPAWYVMKRRAQLAVASRLPKPDERDGSLVDPSREGAARLLVLKLASRIARCGDRPAWRLPQDGPLVPVEITLVGHSMGAILLNRLLTVAGQTLPFRRIVYLAAASGVDELESFVVPYMLLHQTTEFWWFGLSRYHEVREDYVLPPRGTLLAWIDSFFEPARTAGQSTLGRARNVLSYYRKDDVVEEDSFSGKRLVSKVGGPLPPKRVFIYVMDRSRGDLPRRHGDFSEPRFLGEVLCEVEPAAFTAGFCGPGGRVKQLKPDVPK